MRGEPLDLAHRSRIEALLTALDTGFSEYSFANLYLFRRPHGYRFLDGDAPCVHGMTYDGRRHVMPLTPVEPDMIGQLHPGEMLYPVDTGDLAALPAHRATFDAADSDYIYATPDLARLEGARDKGRQAAIFDREQQPVLVIDPPDAEPLAFAVLDRWIEESGRARADTDYDECAEAIALGDQLGLECALVVARGAALGFLLASRLPDGSKAVHFAKGSRVLTGCYPWLFSRYAAASGVARLNFEQDLGKPGFRQAKRALGPVGQLHKYRIE